jgi:hypothetical protein
VEKKAVRAEIKKFVSVKTAHSLWVAAPSWTLRVHFHHYLKVLFLFNKYMCAESLLKVSIIFVSAFSEHVPRNNKWPFL